MKVGVAGTFNVLHRGHRVLLNRAFSIGTCVVVGITSDNFPVKKKFRIPLERRIDNLKDFLLSQKKKWEIEVLEDGMGSAAYDRDLEALVVSESTVENARKINDVRLSRGLRPLVIESIKHVLGEDCATITSTRVLKGEIDEDGKLLRPLRVNVGSANAVKVDAVRNVLGDIYRSIDVKAVRVKTSVEEQPWGNQILKGATNRAILSIRRADYGVGIEAGILEMDDGLYGIQWCAIVDKEGRITAGQSSVFRYPPQVEERIKEGIPVSEIFDSLYGTRDVGHHEGAIGYLTKGLMSRRQLSEQAILAAMVPRMRPDIYFEI